VPDLAGFYALQARNLGRLGPVAGLMFGVGLLGWLLWLTLGYVLWSRRSMLAE